jgi:hypothetical protein
MLDDTHTFAAKVGTLRLYNCDDEDGIELRRAPDAIVVMGFRVKELETEKPWAPLGARI